MIYGYSVLLLTWFAVWRDGNKPPHHSGGLLHWGCAAHPFIILCAGGHQLSYQDPLQTAVVHTFPKPPATWKPAQHTHFVHFL